MTSVIVSALRISSLGLRFALTLFLVRLLPLSDVGIYALLVSIVGVAPGAAGLGFSYFVNRDIVDSSNALPMIRDRLLVTLLCGCVLSGIGLLALWSGLVRTAIPPFGVGLIVIIEMIAFDLHSILMFRHRTTMANILFFVRTALWIPVYMVLALYEPQWRKIEGVMLVWLGGLSFWAMANLAIFNRQLRSPALWARPFDRRWFVATLRKSTLVWVSDASLAFGQNVDRFIVASFLGLRATGIYYFFYSIANGAATVAQSATIQIYMPKMRLIFTQVGLQGVLIASRSYLKNQLTVTLIFMSCAVFSMFYIPYLLNRSELYDFMWIGPIISVALFIRAISDYLGIIDYVMEKDFRYNIINISSFSLSLIANILGAHFGGLYGVGITLILSASIIMTVRYRIWRGLGRLVDHGVAR